MYNVYNDIITGYDDDNCCFKDNKEVWETEQGMYNAYCVTFTYINRIGIIMEGMMQIEKE